MRIVERLLIAGDQSGVCRAGGRLLAEAPREPLRRVVGAVRGGECGDDLYAAPVPVQVAECADVDRAIELERRADLMRAQQIVVRATMRGGEIDNLLLECRRQLAHDFEDLRVLCWAGSCW